MSSSNLMFSFLFPSDHFSFLVGLETNKKKNGISKTCKDCLFAFEEFMKNKTSFEKGRVRPGLDRLTGGTYTRIHAIKGLSKKEAFAPTQTGMWWGNLFKWISKAT